jgi:hypothetical protein
VAEYVLGETCLEELFLFSGELTDGVDLLNTVGLEARLRQSAWFNRA